MKENGFAIGLLIGTLVIGGGLVAFGVSQGNKYSELSSEYSDIKSDVERMAKVKPFPTKENQEERKTEVIAFRGKVEALQNAIQSYRPEEMTELTPAEFQKRLVLKADELKALFKSKGISSPENFALGMENYLDLLPQKEATAKLNYQLEATDWLYRELIKNEVFAIRNAVREALPSESGEDWRRPFDEARPPQPVPLAQSLPMEVVFLAEEASASSFINTLTASEKFFFTVDMVRVANENVTPPVRSQSGIQEDEEEAEDDGGGFGDFGDFGAFEEEEEGEAEAKAEEAPVVEEGLILGQVLGSEALYVGLQIRLLLFDEPFELPEFN